MRLTAGSSSRELPRFARSTSETARAWLAQMRATRSSRSSTTARASSGVQWAHIRMQRAASTPEGPPRGLTRRPGLRIGVLWSAALSVRVLRCANAIPPAGDDPDVGVGRDKPQRSGVGEHQSAWLQTRRCCTHSHAPAHPSTGPTACRVGLAPTPGPAAARQSSCPIHWRRHASAGPVVAIDRLDERGDRSGRRCAQHLGTPPATRTTGSFVPCPGGSCVPIRYKQRRFSSFAALRPATRVAPSGRHPQGRFSVSRRLRCLP